MKGEIGKSNDIFFYFANGKIVSSEQYFNDLDKNFNKKDEGFDPKKTLYEMINNGKNPKPEIVMDDCLENITLKVDDKYKYYIVRFSINKNLRFEIKYEGLLLVGMSYPIKDREDFPTHAEILNGVITFKTLKN